MTVNPARVSQRGPGEGRPTMADMIERLSRFDGPPEQFLVNLLAVQCHLAVADAGAILRINREQQAEVLAVYPPPKAGSTAPVWLARSAEAAPAVVSAGKASVLPLHGADDLYGQPASQHLVMLPLRGGSGVLGLATFLVSSADAMVLAAAQQRLELTVSLLSLYEMRLTLQQRQLDLNRLRLAMETVAAVNEQERFAGAAMALCNEVSSRWHSERVGVGFLKGRYVQLKGLSHTEKFSRKMELVQHIEAAMEEAVDQDVEITHPSPPEATFVSRATAELSRRHGPSSIVSLPLRHRGEVAGVLTLERSAEAPFALDEIEALRLTCDLVTPRLVAMYHQDRWFGARAAAAARKGLAALVGPKYTWIKVLGIALAAGLAFVFFWPATFKAEAPFVFEAITQQVVPAPFDGYLKQVYVEPNDVVIGTRGEPSWLLGPGSIKDLKGLLATIYRQSRTEGPSPGKHLWSLLSESTRRSAAMAAEDVAGDKGAKDGTGGGAAAIGADGETAAGVLADLNGLLAGDGLYSAEAWKAVQPGPRHLRQRLGDLLDLRARGMLERPAQVELNRLLLAAAWPDNVSPGPTVLATLETAELRLELKSAEAEHLSYTKQAFAARREDKRAEAQIAEAQADKIMAQIRLLQHRIKQATLVSPIDGCVVTGDLRKQLGAPVKTGTVLFEVASLEDLRAELSVPEDLIADVQEAFEKARRGGAEVTGELASASAPDERIAFSVERIDPVAEVVNQKNIFKVRARLARSRYLLRPGMEGIAKINIDRRSYAYIWTRELVNWIRMKLWI